MNVPHLDSSLIKQLKELLDDHFGELVERFISDGTVRLQKIRDAIDSEEFDVIHAQAHGLKGSSRNVGAGTLAEFCEDLEARGKERNSAGMQQLFAATEQEFAAVCRELAAQ